MGLCVGVERDDHHDRPDDADDNRHQHVRIAGMNCANPPEPFRPTCGPAQPVHATLEPHRQHTVRATTLFQVLQGENRSHAGFIHRHAKSRQQHHCRSGKRHSHHQESRVEPWQFAPQVALQNIGVCDEDHEADGNPQQQEGSAPTACSLCGHGGVAVTAIGVSSTPGRFRQRNDAKLERTPHAPSKHLNRNCGPEVGSKRTRHVRSEGNPGYGDGQRNNQVRSEEAGNRPCERQRKQGLCLLQHGAAQG